MKRLLLLALIPVSVLAQDQCRLSSSSVTNGTAVLKNTTVLARSVAPEPWGWKNCQVQMQAEVNNTTYQGVGKFSWADGRSAEEACSVAQERAVLSIQAQVGNVRVNTTKHMDCAEDGVLPVRPGPPKVSTVFAVGYVDDLYRFPIYNPRRPFPHRLYPGSTCLEFLHPSNRIGGTVCQTDDSRWVVVDIKTPSRVQ